MLGLKLIHVNKRGHIEHMDIFLDYVFAIGEMIKSSPFEQVVEVNSLAPLRRDRIIRNVILCMLQITIMITAIWRH